MVAGSKSGTLPGCGVFYHHVFRWCRSLRDLNHRLHSGKPPACFCPI